MKNTLSRSITNFENLENKFSEAVTSDSYKKLIELFKKHEDIYVIGNGGLHYVASHMATDISRLVPDKYCHSFDSFGFITSSANDFGFDTIFERWIDVCVNTSNRKGLIIGLSCSGTSKNIVNAFEYGKKIGWDVFLVSGRPTNLSVPHIEIGAKHFHTVEVFCLMLFYEIIHSLGHSCPEI